MSYNQSPPGYNQEPPSYGQGPGQAPPSYGQSPQYGAPPGSSNSGYNAGVGEAGGEQPYYASAPNSGPGYGAPPPSYNSAPPASQGYTERSLGPVYDSPNSPGNLQLQQVQQAGYVQNQGQLQMANQGYAPQNPVYPPQNQMNQGYNQGMGMNPGMIQGMSQGMNQGYGQAPNYNQGMPVTPGPAMVGQGFEGASQQNFTRHDQMSHDTVTATAKEFNSTTDCRKGGQQTTYLDLHYNDISRINLGRWPNIVKLNLHSNHLSNLNGVAAARNLQWIDCGNNDITDIGGIAGLNNLLYFSAAENSLTYVQIPALPALEHIDLSTNDITNLSGLDRCPNLKSVYLDSNNLKSSNDITALTRCPRLQELRITNNDFSENDIRRIQDTFRAYPQIRLEIDGGGGGQNRGPTNYAQTGKCHRPPRQRSGCLMCCTIM